MTRDTIQLRVAENINQLSSDGSTVLDGRILADSINNKINDIYREELFPMFSDKFPNDFKQWTYPLATYTSSGTVDSSSTGTTLVTTDDTFVNSMEGFTVQNSTDGTSAEIETYTSATQVTLDSTIGDTWDGDSIYILGNEIAFKGSTTDLKETIRVVIKYASTDTYFTDCKLKDEKDEFEVGNETFSESNPLFYPTTVKVSDVPTPAVGILPYPSDYQGSLKVQYIQRPPELGASSEPSLNVQGLCEVIINGVTAWAKRLKGDKTWVEWQTLYEGNPRSRTPSGKLGLVLNYKPKTRSGPTRILPSTYVKGLRRRDY